MGAKQIAKGFGRLLTHALWPWPAIQKSIRQFSTQKDLHKENILYIKELTSRTGHKVGSESASPQSFEEMMRKRPADAPSIQNLERRFLRQKRLAIGTCAAFIVMAGYAISNGNLLGIATILSCMPLFFMACLSAQFRLWQLHARRLSKEEGGGLRDFMREVDGWYWRAIDPDFGYKSGGES